MPVAPFVACVITAILALYTLMQVLRAYRCNARTHFLWLVPLAICFISFSAANVPFALGLQTGSITKWSLSAFITTCIGTGSLLLGIRNLAKYRDPSRK